MAKKLGTIWQRPNGLFSAEISCGIVNGKRARKTVYGRSEDEVKDKLALARIAIKNEGFVRASPLTVTSYLDDWLIRRRESTTAGLRSSTAALYEGIIRNHIAAAIGMRRLDKLTPEHIESMYTTLATTSIRRKVDTLLRGAMKEALRAGRLRRNPMHLVRAPRYVPPEAKILTDEEAENLLTFSAGDSLHALYLIALDTGMRQGELFGLRRSDLDLKNRTISVRRTVRYGDDGQLIVSMPKSGKSRCVPISQRSVEALKAHAKANMEREYVFSDSAGRALRKENFARRSWRPLLEKAGLSLKFHGLRHTCATRLLKQGVNPKVVSDRLGHASVQVTLDIYSHVIPGLSREAADLFDAMIAGGD